MRKAFNEFVNECKEATYIFHAAMQQDMKDRFWKLEEVVEQLQLHINDQDDTIAILKCVLANGPSSGAMLKIQMKEPNPFNGT